MRRRISDDPPEWTQGRGARALVVSDEKRTMTVLIYCKATERAAYKKRYGSRLSAEIRAFMNSLILTKEKRLRRAKGEGLDDKFSVKVGASELWAWKLAFPPKGRRGRAGYTRYGPIVRAYLNEKVGIE